VLKQRTQVVENWIAAFLVFQNGSRGELYSVCKTPAYGRIWSLF